MNKCDKQNFPVVDSPHNDAFEAIVELYYQISGYITSSGKWFWVRGSGKKQRGYQEIDVLAVNREDVIIVSVTSGLDDKIRFNKRGQPRNDMFKKLQFHFSRIEEYLRQVPQYEWLMDKNVKKVVAYVHGFKQCSYSLKVSDLLKQHGNCFGGS